MKTILQVFASVVIIYVVLVIMCFSADVMNNYKGDYDIFLFPLMIIAVIGSFIGGIIGLALVWVWNLPEDNS